MVVMVSYLSWPSVVIRGRRRRRRRHFGGGSQCRCCANRLAVHPALCCANRLVVDPVLCFDALLGASYLGSIAHIEDYHLFGYVSNSGVKIILCTDDGKSVSKLSMRSFFEEVEQAYVDYAASPFVDEEATIVSKNFSGGIKALVEKRFGSNV